MLPTKVIQEHRKRWDTDFTPGKVFPKIKRLPQNGGSELPNRDFRRPNMNWGLPTEAAMAFPRTSEKD